MRIEPQALIVHRFLWLLLGLAFPSIGFGQAGMEERVELVFNTRATGELSLHVSKAAVYSDEPPFVPIVLSDRFQSNVDIPPASRKALAEVYEKYQKAVGELFILQSRGQAQAKDRLKVDEQIKPLMQEINGLNRTVITRAKEIALARDAILMCLKHPELLDAEQFRQLRLDLAKIETSAYEKLLNHCTDAQRKSFSRIVLAYHPNLSPLPSLLHDQLTTTGAFSNPKSQALGFRFTKACSIAASQNTGIGSPAELKCQDLIHLVGSLSDQSNLGHVSEIYLRYDSDRAKAEKADERMDLARKFRDSVFSLLSEEQAKELREKLFAAHVRRYGVFAMETSGEEIPVEIKPMLEGDSLQQIRAKAAAVAVEIRKAVNARAVTLIQSVSNDNLRSLIELNYPIPIELTMSETRL